MLGRFSKNINPCFSKKNVAHLLLIPLQEPTPKRLSKLRIRLSASHLGFQLPLLLSLGILDLLIMFKLGLTKEGLPFSAVPRLLVSKNCWGTTPNEQLAAETTNDHGSTTYDLLQSQLVPEIRGCKMELIHLGLEASSAARRGQPRRWCAHCTPWRHRPVESRPEQWTMAMTTCWSRIGSFSPLFSSIGGVLQKQ